MSAALVRGHAAITPVTRAQRITQWCAADPGSMPPTVTLWVPALRGTVKNAAPRPGHASRRRHGLLHRRHQLAQRERLRQEGELLVFRQALLEGVFRIARHEDDLEVGIAA